MSTHRGGPEQIVRAIVPGLRWAVVVLLAISVTYLVVRLPFGPPKYLSAWPGDCSTGGPDAAALELCVGYHEVAMIVGLAAALAVCVIAQASRSARWWRHGAIVLSLAWIPSVVLRAAQVTRAGRSLASIDGFAVPFAVLCLSGAVLLALGSWAPYRRDPTRLAP